jgi:hypothetical protein
LIKARLIPALEEEQFEVLPVIRVTHELPPDVQVDAAAHNRYVLSTLQSLDEGLPKDKQHRLDELARMTIVDYLRAWPDLDDRPGNEVLVFDQFEEIIIADPTDRVAKEEFFAQLGMVLRDRTLWALFAMREDLLAELDPYVRFLPTRLATRYRLDLLTVDEALQAMTLPARDAGVTFKPDAARKLVDDLRRIRVQRAEGVIEDLGPYVEPAASSDEMGGGSSRGSGIVNSRRKPASVTTSPSTSALLGGSPSSARTSGSGPGSASRTGSPRAGP